MVFPFAEVEDFALFANLRKEFKFKARKRQCEDDIKDEITSETKDSFSYSESLRKTNSIHFRSKLAEDRDYVCILSAKYFSSVFQYASYREFVMNQISLHFYITDRCHG